MVYIHRLLSVTRFLPTKRHLCIFLIAGVLNAQGHVDRGSVVVDNSVTPLVLLPPLHEAELTKEALQDLLDQAQRSDDVLTDEFRVRAAYQVPSNSSPSSYTQDRLPRAFQGCLPLRVRVHSSNESASALLHPGAQSISSVASLRRQS